MDWRRAIAVWRGAEPNRKRKKPGGVAFGKCRGREPLADHAQDRQTVTRVSYLLAGIGKGDCHVVCIVARRRCYCGESFFLFVAFCLVGLAAAAAGWLLSSSASAQPASREMREASEKREKALAAETQKAAADCDQPRYNSAVQSFVASKVSHGYTEGEATQVVFKFYPYPQCSALPSPVFFPGAQPFVGFNIGGGFQGTNFSVDPQFNVNGSGVIGGGFGGVLFPIPNTNAQAGFRIGGEGGNIIGNIGMPAASPLFTYTVRTDWMAYQEAMVKIGGLSLPPGFQGYLIFPTSFGLFYTASVGVAESGTSVKGTLGPFTVIDNTERTGIHRRRWRARCCLPERHQH